MLDYILLYCTVLFIQICTAARNATKHSAPCVLFLQDKCATTCPVGEDFVKQYFYPRCNFDSTCCPTLLIGSKCSRLVRETQDVFLGERLVTTCPVAKEHLGPADHYLNVI